MTIAQFFVAYATCWWLVLFMLLPSGAQPVQNPAPGHAPSAPANPRLKKKAMWTTLLAILPTLLIYLVATNAKAEETIYHVGSNGCDMLEKYTPSADLSTKDGEGANGKKVKGANLDDTSAFMIGDVDIPIAIPSDNYIDPTKHNLDTSQSFIQAGKLTVKQDGDTLLNGKSISGNQYYSGDCNGKK
ncbi:MAG: DUF1467 family protein [Rickettsiales bacterium]